VLAVSTASAITQQECQTFVDYGDEWRITPYEVGQYIGYGGVTLYGRTVTQGDIRACRDEGKLCENFANPLLIGHQMGSNLKWRLENQE
jgi:hypothetical protein